MKRYIGLSGYKAIWLDLKVRLDAAREAGATPERIAELESCVEHFREKGEAGEPLAIPKYAQRMYERAVREMTEGISE